MIKTSGSSFTKSNTLLALQFLSDFGDQITASLLALLVLDISKSTSKVGLVYFVSTVGFIFFTLFGGFIGDRISKRNILVSTDLGRGIVVLLMIVAFRERSIWLIYAASFMLSCLGSLQRPSRTSAWTQSVPASHLERYNSLSELSVQASTIFGPIIASFLVLKSWTNLGFIVDAATFFLCAMAFAFILRREAPTTPVINHSQRRLGIGFKLLAQHAQMSRYVAYDALQMLGFGAFNATFLVLAQRDFGWSKLQFSYHLSIIAALCVVGAMLGATKFMTMTSPLKRLVISAVVSSVSLWIILVVKSFPLSSLLFGLCNGAVVMTVSITRTKIQMIANRDHSDLFASIIAARSVVIKVATLTGTGLCLLVDNVMNLSHALAFFVIPIAASIVPIVLVEKRSAAIENSQTENEN